MKSLLLIKGYRHEKFFACISSNEMTPRHIIRKAARLASRYNTVFSALYVQTPVESTERIPSCQSPAFTESF